MKVLFTFGGMPHYLVSLLSRLVNDYKVEVVVVLPGNEGKTIGKGVKLNNEGAKFRIIYANEYNTISGKPYFKKFNKILKSEKPDIIVTAWPYILNFSFDIKSRIFIKKKKIGIVLKEIPFQVAPGNELFSFYKMNLVIDEKGKNITPKGIKFYIWALSLWLIRNWYYRMVDATVAYTEMAYKVDTSYGVREEAIFISRNSIDTKELFVIKESLRKQPLIYSYNPYRLIHIGRLVKWKRVDLIIQILPELKKKFPEADLLIIGKGPEEDVLKKMAVDLNISDSIKFLGAIYEYEKIGQYLLSSGIYILAGMGGLSINEAMAFGKPVICSIGDGTEKALVRDGFNGLYFKNGSADSLFDKIEYLFNNINLIETMGKNSENIIFNEINIFTVTEVYNQAFNFVYNKKKNKN